MNQLVEDLFCEAMNLDPAEREPFLLNASGGRPSVVHEVLRLVADGEKAESLFANSVSRLASSLELAPGTQIGVYTIRHKIGEGGMGVVYLADRADGQFDQRVAIKLVQGGPGLVGRFLRERRILARLSHPGIARLIDGGLTAEGHPYMVMEYFEGQPFSTHCQSLSLRQKLELFQSICAAVEYAHRNPIVHRDLKPANILVSAEGAVKLLDFGIARILAPSAQGDLTGASQQAFTPDYASPEQIRGDEITTAADVYSLGTVLFECLTGQSPHRLKTYTPHELTEVICNQPAPALQLGNDLDAILAKALRKEPERRYPSVASFSEDIGRFLDNRPVSARADSALYRTKKFVRRHAFASAAGVIAVLSLAAGLGVATWQARVASNRFNQVRQLARTVLFDFDDKIRTVPGATPARDFLAKTAVAYLDKLSAEASGDRSLQLELAAAYEKVADVQGEPARPNLGQRKNALANYFKDQQLLESNPASDPVALARLLLKRQTILGEKPLLDQAQTIATQAWKNEPNREDALAVLLQTEQAMGQYQSNRSEFDAAIAHYRTATELASTQSRRWPGNRANLNLISSDLRLGDAQLRKGEPGAALASFNDAQAANNRLLQTEPDNVEHLRRAFKVNLFRGHALGNPEYFNLGRTPEAKAAYEAAMALSSKLLSVDPGNALARGDYSDAAWGLAVSIASTEPQRARQLLEASVKEAKAVSAKSPTTLAFIHNSANSQYALAKVLRSLGQRELSTQYVTESIRLHRSIAAARPKQIGLRHNLMPSLTLQLNLQLDRKDIPAARATWSDLEAIIATVDRKASNFRSKAPDIAAAQAAAARFEPKR
ncbi:MAG: serine/threonine protein kinase [Acidobacteria bacterium]|nr:serine/threonine protein kinase [Acidobacteriota bacterium]